VALLPVLLLGHRQQRLCVCILGGPTTAGHLLREKAPLPAVGIQFGGIQTGDLQHHGELVVGSASALRVDLGERDHLSPQSPSHTPLVEDIA